MNTVENSGERGRIIGLQERRLGKTVLRTYRTKLDIDDILPNERQPRQGPKEDEELQRQIERTRACSSHCWWSRIPHRR